MVIPNIGLAELLLGGVIAMVVASPVHATEKYGLGVCQTSTQSMGVEIRPTMDADSYLVNYHGDDSRYKAKLANGEFFSAAKMTLIKSPKHGKVAYADNPNAVEWNWYHYMPEDGYVGRDNFVMQVEQDGVKVRIEYLIEGLNEGEPATGICERSEWKISANTRTLDNVSLQAFANAVGIRNTIKVVSLPHIISIT